MTYDVRRAINGQPPLPSPEEVARQQAAQPAGAGPGRLVQATLSGRAILGHYFERPPSLLGNGIISAGDLVIVYGQGGVAKTWLSMMLALAFATDDAKWFGLDTGGAAPTGYVELELLGHTVQDRIRALVGEHVPDDLHLIVRPHLSGTLDLVRRDGQPCDIGELREWITTFGLKVVIIDALARATTLEQVDFSPLLLALDSLRADTGCAIVLVHHEPKNTEKDADSDLDALRGDSRLRDFPQCLIRVLRHRAVMCARFSKVSCGVTPEPLYFELGHNGVPFERPKPESASSADETLARFEKFICEAPEPVSRANILSSIVHVAGRRRGEPYSASVVSDKVKRLLDEARISAIGKGNQTLYTRPESSGSSGLSDSAEPDNAS